MVQANLSADKYQLTAERVREVISYCPETGKFEWIAGARQGRGGPRKSTNEAGFVCATHKYRLLCIDNCKHAAHRIAWLLMTGSWPTHEVDHINGIRSDNRWCNLRHATSAQNGRNRLRASNNTSGVKGLSWNKAQGKWHARIWIDGRNHHLGFFACYGHAIKARRAAEIEHFGRFSPRQLSASVASQE